MVLKRRHLAKAITYRFFGSVVTALCAWLITKSYKISFLMFLLDSIGKIFLYYLHERVWYCFKWGIVSDQQNYEPDHMADRTSVQRQNNDC